MKKLMALTLLFGVFTGGAMAAVGKVLTDSVIAKFNESDLALMTATVDQALKADKDGEKLDWKNEKTGASGQVTPLARFQANGLACRRLRVVNHYRQQTGSGVYRYCEKPAGQWKLVGPDKAPA
ncbi:RT0821/Lpp0805 family surface protein [Variovorax sp. HJSM1_2]|uniref:RT0821/Lpp0805 family surface protein n=1 Tax=Variovorax sp. HJSM1_2 TaxID=3366263 RepID=UPI003BE22250